MKVLHFFAIASPQKSNIDGEIIKRYRLNSTFPVSNENVPVLSENIPVPNENVPVSSENVLVSSENVSVSSAAFPVLRWNDRVVKVIA